jgi:hypothetical protein
MIHRDLELDGLFVRSRQGEMDPTFGTWNIKILFRAGSLKTVASEMAKNNLDIAALQKVRWVEGGN